MSENKSMKVVFISHSCLDHKIVHELQKELQTYGLTVVVDDFQGGDRTCDKTQRKIKESTHFILLATENSINSKHEYKARQYSNESWHRARWVTVEYTCAEHCALQQGLTLICVKVGNIAIPQVLQHFIYVPFIIDSSVSQLSENLTSCINSTMPSHKLSTDPQRSKKLVEMGRNLERVHATFSRDDRELHSAIEFYEQAISFDFCNHHAWLNKGWCLWKLKSDTVAWKYVNMAQLLRPDSDRLPDILKRMTDGYRTLKD